MTIVQFLPEEIHFIGPVHALYKIIELTIDNQFEMNKQMRQYLEKHNIFGKTF